ncbi:MAG TPA: DegQ family serine endoprotease [Candidatus Binataceae bacterium]|nr:DegQ family serine endoprotease [Candidatus Binataceae bacterium]
MRKWIAALSGGVLIGVTIAFARTAAFGFWGFGDNSSPEPTAASAPPPSAPVAAPSVPVVGGHAGAGASFAPLVKRVMPTVVTVSVVEDIKVNAGPFGMPGGGDEGAGPNDDNGEDDQGEGGPPGMGGGNPMDQFRRFFGQFPREYKQHGIGSGVIVSSDGFILTNNHVVGNAESIHVTLMDKREFTAKVIGKDPKTDLALIKIDTKESLPVATLGDSDAMQIGDWVVAIGNPFGFSLTVTAGIVSAKGRILGGDYDDYMQTDASINPGNSGGPLFDTNGQVVGINTAIYSPTQTNNGIGFAIPINMAKNVMEQLKAHGHVIRGWLGVEIQEVTPDLAQSFGLPKPEGALIAGVDKTGPAAKGGIERGDIVMKFNGHDVHDEHELPALVAQTPIDAEVPVEIIRNGNHMNLKVTIGERKETQVVANKGEEAGGSWGIQVTDITPEIAQQLHLESTKGVLVRHVNQDSPAADAGLRPGDIILEINHEKVESFDDFKAQAQNAKASKKPTLLLVQRGGASVFTVIKPAEAGGQE